MMKYLDDALIVLGEALLVLGAYLVAPVSAVFAAGILLIVDGVLIGAGRREK